MSRTNDRENLRYRYLSEKEIGFISKSHPEVEKQDYCPTCSGDGYYLFRRKNRKRCDCELQVQMYRHYLSAGIPTLYQRLDWKDFEGPRDVLDAANNYLKNLEKYVQSGFGLYLTGSNGIGKTFVLTLILKDLVAMGYRCFFTTADAMFEMKTDGWKDDEEKERYNSKVRNSKILVIDDAGKEFANRLTDQTFESLVRYRAQNSLTTLVSSNQDMVETRAKYGESFYSLITGSFIHYDLSGDDFRPTARDKRLEEIDKNWTRPIL